MSNESRYSRVYDEKGELIDIEKTPEIDETWSTATINVTVPVKVTFKVTEDCKNLHLEIDQIGLEKEVSKMFLTAIEEYNKEFLQEDINE